MRRIVLCLFVVAAAGRIGLADTFNLSTGLDASNNLIATGGVNDAHWTVTTDPTFSPTGIPQTVFPNNADWFGGWLANGPNSDWIARNANVTDNGPSPYTFTRTFDLTGFNVSTASLSGAWAVDDTGTLSLNGHLLSTLGSGAWGALTAFSDTGASGDFVQGINTLTMTITSNDRFLEAVRLDGSLTVRAVPEPSSFGLIGVGGTGIALAARRRRVRAHRA